MNSNNPNDPVRRDDWAPCREGEIAELVRRLRSRKQRRVTSQVAVVASCLLLAGFAVGRFALENNPSSAVAELSCEQILDLAPAYFAGDLESARVEYITSHLTNCRHCQDVYDDVRRGREEATLRLPTGETLLLTDSSHAVALR